jgi:hypothetical protein
MKRIVTLITILAFGTALSVNAQDPIMSKKGTPIVYEAGDWGIGIDAWPFLEYLGNAFNHDDNDAPFFTYADRPMVISGFMVQDPNSAYRAKVGINFWSMTQVYKATNDADATGLTQVDDEQKTSYNQITLGVGIQKMRGKHRLRGIYGAEVELGFGGATKTENTYGNAFTPTNLNPTTAIPGQPTFAGRETESKSGGTFFFGIRGFIGVEYFVAPKISLTGEFGWGPYLESTGEGESTVESATLDANGNLVVTSRTTNTGKSSSFSVAVDNMSGNIRGNFYF